MPENEALRLGSAPTTQRPPVLRTAVLVKKFRTAPTGGAATSFCFLPRGLSVLVSLDGTLPTADGGAVC